MGRASGHRNSRCVPWKSKHTRHDHLTPLLYIKEVCLSSEEQKPLFCSEAMGFSGTLKCNPWGRAHCKQRHTKHYCFLQTLFCLHCELWDCQDQRDVKHRGYKHITALMQCKQCTWKEQFDLISLSSAFRTNITSAWSLWLVLEQSFCCVSCDNFCGHVGKCSTNT